MIVAGWVVDIYCDNREPDGDCDAPYKEDDDSVGGHTRKECERQLRRAGWMIGRRYHLCPTCNARSDKLKIIARLRKANQ